MGAQLANWPYIFKTYLPSQLMISVKGVIKSSVITSLGVIKHYYYKVFFLES